MGGAGPEATEAGIMRNGVRSWILRAGHDMRAISAPSLLSMLCAAAARQWLSRRRAGQRGSARPPSPARTGAGLAGSRLLAGGAGWAAGAEDAGPAVAVQGGGDLGGGLSGVRGDVEPAVAERPGVPGEVGVVAVGVVPASSRVRAAAIRSRTVSSTVVRGSCHGGCHCATRFRDLWITTPRSPPCWPGRRPAGTLMWDSTAVHAGWISTIMGAAGAPPPGRCRRGWCYQWGAESGLGGACAGRGPAGQPACRGCRAGASGAGWGWGWG